jgi:GntR family transcriptional repressor for pyruvate dehydrogenase complex
VTDGSVLENLRMTDRKQPTIRPVPRLKLSDSVAAEIERSILRGDYEVGEKLPPERRLAEQLGIWRSSMREALRIVEASGLVRIEHGIGVFVAATEKRPLVVMSSDLLVLGEQTVSELFEVRRVLERDAAGLAAKRVTPSEAAALEAIVAAARHPELSDDEFIEYDAELHRAIVQATKNRLMLRIFEGIEPLFVTYSRRVIHLPGRRANAQRGHKQVVDAIVARRPREARNAMVRHVREAERDIADALNDENR